MSSHINILLVEDDKNAAYLLKENLLLDAYKVQIAVDGEEGLALFQQQTFDLCILDIMLPKKDGLLLAKDIRSLNSEMPIIFLTARSLGKDIIDGFKIGCDDYITKPYNIAELLLRIKAILRRLNSNRIEAEKQYLYEYPNVTFRIKERLLIIGDVKYHLSTKENEILQQLFANRGEIVTRTDIMKSVWGQDDYYTSKNLDVCLTKIRKYFNKSNHIELINIHGQGYRLMIK